MSSFGPKSNGKKPKSATRGCPCQECGVMDSVVWKNGIKMKWSHHNFRPSKPEFGPNSVFDLVVVNGLRQEHGHQTEQRTPVAEARL